MKKEREDNLAFDRVDYIQSKNLMNENVVYGFGSNKLCIKEIDRNVANGIIKKNHYSKKYYQLSYIHLGVYSDNVLCGVLQFGYAMNPASGCKVVKNTANDEYLELNRMWIYDVMPRNTESMVMSYSIKYIKKKYPKVNWIQSFADERCGGLGVVYQACNFKYYGEHTSIFWEYAGQMYHNITMTAKQGAGGTMEQVLQNNKDKCKKYIFRQFRYIYFINKKSTKGILLNEKPYPKRN